MGARGGSRAPSTPRPHDSRAPNVPQRDPGDATHHGQPLPPSRQQGGPQVGTRPGKPRGRDAAVQALFGTQWVAEVVDIEDPSKKKEFKLEVNPAGRRVGRSVCYAALCCAALCCACWWWQQEQHTAMSCGPSLQSNQEVGQQLNSGSLGRTPLPQDLLDVSRLINTDMLPLMKYVVSPSEIQRFSDGMMSPQEQETFLAKVESVLLRTDEEIAREASTIARIEGDPNYALEAALVTTPLPTPRMSSSPAQLLDQLKPPLMEAFSMVSRFDGECTTCVRFCVPPT